jgi:transposase
MRIHLDLSADQRAELEKWVKHPPKPYLRERARAILRVADGEPILQVAASLRVRVGRDTVGNWVKRYRAQGLQGLHIQSGRGRKPAFSPSEPPASQR